VIRILWFGELIRTASVGRALLLLPQMVRLGVVLIPATDDGVAVSAHGFGHLN
jgi:hypothetical protein